MRILLLSQVVPYPPDAGPKVKTYNLLRFLAQHHEVHLLSFVRSESEAMHGQALRQHCCGVTTVPIRRSRRRDALYLVKSMATGRPFLVERDDSRMMRAAVRRLLAERPFDAIHADQLTMAQFAIDQPVRLHVLDEHNAVWTIIRRMCRDVAPGPKRLFMELEWRKLRRYEGELCRRFERTLAVIEEDRRALEDAAGHPCPISVIPIGVDTAELTPVKRNPDARDVLSIATMFYPPNVEGVLWFAREVFPRVKGLSPETCFHVVGARPPVEVQKLAHAEPKIGVTGYVSDVKPLIARSALLIVPVHAGSGMRVKILEAFARGIPVVSTTIGAEGICVQDGQHLLIADDPASFASAVLRVTADRAFADGMARRARRLVEERYDWRVVYKPLAQVYGELASGDNARTNAFGRGV